MAEERLKYAASRHQFFAIAAAMGFVATQAKAPPACTFDACSHCLQDAKNVTANLNIVGPDGLDYQAPLRIGLCPAMWDAQAISATIIGILVSERLGISVEYAACTDEATCYMGVNNCIGWQNYACEQITTLAAAQAAFDAGTKLYPDLLSDLMFVPEVTYPDTTRDKFAGSSLNYDSRPGRALGPSGYSSTIGLYIDGGVVDATWAAFGVDLTSWRSFEMPNARTLLHAPAQLIADGVAAEVLGCSSDVPFVETSMEIHRKLGFVCTNTSWWLNPACSSLGARWISDCIVMLDDDWGFGKPALYMALAESAVPVAKLMVGYDEWFALTVNESYNVTFDWWAPDATLATIRPKRINFPQETESQPDVVLKAAWKPAIEADWRLRQLLGHTYLDPHTILGLMDRTGEAYVLGHQPGAAMYQKLACDWVRENEATWSAWLPSAGSCSTGQFFDRLSQSCAPCPAGSQWEKLNNGTLLCQPCLPGTHSQFAGMTACEACPMGTFQGQVGSSSCSKCQAGSSQSDIGRTQCLNCTAGRVAMDTGSSDCLRCTTGTWAPPGASSCSACSLGTYAAAAGASVCAACPGEMTTLGRGSADAEDSACAAGQYRPLGTEPDKPAVQCSACPEYMYCPTGSDVSRFGRGDTSAMQLLPGYMTREANPLKVYRCASERECPGGGPGHCGPLRDVSAVACGQCEYGAYETGGSCKSCGSLDAVPLVLFALVSACALCLVAAAASRGARSQTHSQLAVFVLLGLSFTCVQTFGVFRQVKIGWVNPMDYVFKAVALLSFDLTILKFECFTQTTPLFKLASRQLTPLLCSPVIVAALLIMKFFVPTTEVGVGAVNAVGTVYSVLFISILMSCAAPLICYPHPDFNGSSMLASPSILCFEGGAHSWMLASSAVSFFLVPLAFVVLAVFGTFRYHVYCSRLSEHNTLRLRQFRFLFFRFRANQYFYGLVQILRSFLLCLVPVVVGNLGLQIVILCIVIWSFALVQLQLKPWRSEATNVIDGVLSFLLVILLFCGLMASDLKVDREAIMLFGTVSFFTLVCSALGGLIAGVLMLMRRRPWYEFFICHCKANAQAQARLLKIRLSAETKKRVFIDSDNLTELDVLFDIVRSKVGTLIAYLTRDTLTRAWCVGEIVTAVRSKRKILAIMTPSFQPPTAREMQDLGSYCNLDGSGLARYVIAAGDVASAFNHLFSEDTVSITMPNAFFGQHRFEDMLLNLWSALDMRMQQQESTRSMRSMSSTASSGDNVVISSHPCSDEASAAAAVLITKIHHDVLTFARRGVRCIGPDDMDQVDTIVSKARAVVVLLCGDTLMSLPQLRVVALAMVLYERAGGRGDFAAAAIPVTLPGFQFPGTEYYQETLPKIWPGCAASIPYHIQAFFRVIAVHFATDASDELLTTQAHQVTSRIPRVTRRRTDVPTEESAGAIMGSTGGPQYATAAEEDELGEFGQKGELGGEHANLETHGVMLLTRATKPSICKSYRPFRMALQYISSASSHESDRPAFEEGP